MASQQSQHSTVVEYTTDDQNIYMEQEDEWEREGLLDPAWEKQQKKVCGCKDVWFHKPLVSTNTLQCFQKSTVVRRIFILYLLYYQFSTRLTVLYTYRQLTCNGIY